MIIPTVIDYVASETIRQQAGPAEMAGMFHAWNYCTEKAPTGWYSGELVIPTQMDLLHIGSLINPRINGYRKMPVTFANGGSSLSPQQIPAATVRLFNQLATSFDFDVVESWCQHLLYIHPLQDGNGRTVSLLRNWILDRLLDPEMLPDYNF